MKNTQQNFLMFLYFLDDVSVLLFGQALLIKYFSNKRVLNRKEITKIKLKYSEKEKAKFISLTH